ncbi:MAG: sulfotransferase, partial [Pseudomonadota bacterium]
MNRHAVSTLRHYPELDGKTFLLGVGGMKCATSWVFDYLRGLEGMTASDIKELHFFNSRLRPPGHEPLTLEFVQSIRHFFDNAGDIAEEMRLNRQFQAAVDSLRMLHDDNAYFDYFARICTPETKTLCEVTPQYSVLGKEGFAFLKDFFASQQMRLKIFMVLRDPVERLWSHLRHLQDRDQAGDVLTEWPDLVRRRSVIERS